MHSSRLYATGHAGAKHSAATPATTCRSRQHPAPCSKRRCVHAMGTATLSPTHRSKPDHGEGHTALLQGLGAVGDVAPSHMPWLLRLAYLRYEAYGRHRAGRNARSIKWSDACLPAKFGLEAFPLKARCQSGSNVPLVEVSCELRTKMIKLLFVRGLVKGGDSEQALSDSARGILHMEGMSPIASVGPLNCSRGHATGLALADRLRLPCDCPCRDADCTVW